jgi:hypothetical protein
MSKAKEPRLRIVISPEGIERVEIWGIDRADREVAERLYYGLTDPIRNLGDACKSLSKRSSRS